MLNIIKDNPLRLVGTSANAKMKERLANLSKIKAYAKINKPVSFPYDLNESLGKLDRTLDATEIAMSKLNLPEEFIKYVFFWFYNITPEQQEAAACLANNNIKAAKEIYSKGTDFGSLISTATLAFIGNNNTQGIKLLNTIIIDQELQKQFLDFIAEINGQTTSNISTQYLIELLVGVFIENIPINDLIKIYSTLGKSKFFDFYSDSIKIIKAQNTKLIQSKIEKMIQEETSLDDPAKELANCPDVVKECKLELRNLLKSVDNSSPEYQSLSDTVAKYIIQTVIGYFNTHQSDMSSFHAQQLIELSKKARAMAQSSILKGKCESTLDSVSGYMFDLF